MTVEIWNQTPAYTVSGIGPYAITHPYADGAITATVIVNGVRTALMAADFSVTPLFSITQGDVYLSPSAAATHAGRQLLIDRTTPDEQGWVGVQGEREAGLEAQLDRLTQSIQEIRKSLGGALRIRDTLTPFDWADGTVPLRSGAGVISGPTAADVALAQTRATEAAASAVAAAASAADALAKQNSMLRGRGQWLTATVYAPSDLTYQLGSQYECIVGHTSGVFATDLAASRWRIFAQQGAAGPGTGDMLKTENLSGLANYTTARANLGVTIGAQVQAYHARLANLANMAWATGDLAYFNGANLVRLGVGGPGQVITPIGGIPTWFGGEQGPVTASGTAVNFSSIPANARRIAVMFDALSLSGGDIYLVQIGAGGAPENTGYNSSAGTTDGGSIGSINNTSGFPIFAGYAADFMSGMAILEKEPGSNAWYFQHVVSRAALRTSYGGGRKLLGGVLDFLRVTPSGSNTFDAGTVSIRWSA